MLWIASDKLQVGILASFSKDNFYKHIKGIKFEFRKNKCHDSNLGFMTKGKAYKGVSQECNPGVALTRPGVQESVRE
jgi:hypothetical protein